MHIAILDKTGDHPFPVLTLNATRLNEGYSLGLLQAELTRKKLSFWVSSSETCITLRIPLIPSLDNGLLDFVELTNKLKDGYTNDPS